MKKVKSTGCALVDQYFSPSEMCHRNAHDINLLSLRVARLGSGAGSVIAGILICMPNKCFCFLCMS